LILIEVNTAPLRILKIIYFIALFLHLTMSVCACVHVCVCVCLCVCVCVSVCEGLWERESEIWVLKSKGSERQWKKLATRVKRKEAKTFLFCFLTSSIQLQNALCREKMCLDPICDRPNLFKIMKTSILRNFLKPQNKCEKIKKDFDENQTKKQKLCNRSGRY
jgi:hypothetical protein